MKRFKNILVATDTRFDDHPIVAAAAEIADHNGASLKIVDVVPEFPWAVRLTLKDYEHMRQLIADEQQEKLDALAAPIRAKGLRVETKVLMGKTSVEIIREVMRGQHDLVLRVAKGKDSRASGYFGTTGTRLLRKCPCSVWLVTPETTPRFTHVMGCVDPAMGEHLDEELNDKIYELASSIARYHGGRFSVVHAWSIWNEKMLKRRLKPDEFAQMEKDNYDQIAGMMDAFLARHDSGIRADNVHILKGEAYLMIPAFARENNVDLVVMGTVARSGLSGLIMGNTAEQILNRIECSVLALKPAGFRCPINLDE